MAYHIFNDSRCEQLRCAVPTRFQKLTGIDKYEFLVWDIRESYDRKRIVVRLHLPEAAESILVDNDRNPMLYEALSLTGSLRSQYPHAERFMRIYKSLECLSKDVSQEFRAIRHSLSHPSAVLNNRATVATLNHLFGTVNVDISCYSHRKVFYRHFVSMLIENDKVLYSVLKGKFQEKHNGSTLNY